MAGDADSFHDTVCFGLCETIHVELAGFAPIAFCHAVHQEDVEIFGVGFLAHTVEGFADRFYLIRAFVVGPHLAHEGEFLTGQAFDGFSDEGLGTVGVGHVEETDAAFVTVAGHPGEMILSCPCLVGLEVPAFRSGTHSDTGDLQSGFS